MIAIILIVTVALFLLWRWLSKSSKQNDIPVNVKQEPSPVLYAQDTMTSIKATEPKPEEDDVYFTDEDGNDYKIVKRIRIVPRRTYILAELSGKFWGLLEEEITEQFHNSQFYDFKIYEMELSNATYRTNEPFHLEASHQIPRDKLPKLLHTSLTNNGQLYEVNLYEPVFANIVFVRKLHQSEGEEVFGTITATVSGYLLELIEEAYEERIYLPKIAPPPETGLSQGAANVPEIAGGAAGDASSLFGQPYDWRGATQIKGDVLTKTNVLTGNVEYRNGAYRYEYYYSNYRNRYWGSWRFQTGAYQTKGKGCLSTLMDGIGLIFGIAFILLILPHILDILPILLIIFLLSLIPVRLVHSSFNILGLLVLVGFLLSLFYLFDRPKKVYQPSPVVKQSPKEKVRERQVINDTINNTPVVDTQIAHYRIWQDYDGNEYEGRVTTRKSDLMYSSNVKNMLAIQPNTPYAYDALVYRLKETDKDRLNGVYHLFDSIRQARPLSSVEFADMIVSFVQDIPYAAILPDDCDPRLYNDDFIRNYLQKQDALCEGHQRYGINTPVEFMSNLMGDCDTRTLFLYTILSHYNYDVALLSSEYYSHSLLGINLPISGAKYRYNNKQYVLWETTAPNIRAGILPPEIANVGHWRISLKSR